MLPGCSLAGPEKEYSTISYNTEMSVAATVKANLPLFYPA